MKLVLEVLTAGEAAFYCRLALGDGYDWSTRLTDWRRGKGVDYGGPVLLTTTTIWSSLKKPSYATSDVKKFIDEYSAYDLTAQRGVKPRSRYIEMDPATGKQRWLARPPAALASAHAH